MFEIENLEEKNFDTWFEAKMLMLNIDEANVSEAKKNVIASMLFKIKESCEEIASYIEAIKELGE